VGWDVRDDEVGAVVRGTKFKVRDEEKQSQGRQDQLVSQVTVEVGVAWWYT